MKFELTAQQKAIVQLSSEGKSLKVKAFAGASKTTTLVLASQVIPHRCLYLAYNKKMQQEALTKFPEHVEVRTVHSMAYQVHGVMIAHKLARPRGAYRNVLGTASEISRAFKIFDIPLANGRKVLAASIGKAVKDTVGAFENSAHAVIGKQHINLGKIKKYVQAGLVNKAAIEEKVLENARKLWLRRIDVQDDCLATHETYLKMFQMSKPNLSAYGTIFLDEAQDSNDCVLDVVLSQKSQVIIVGDDFQSIYQWRGSINALDKVDFTQCELTTSFRFGQDVADTANLILNQTVKADVRGNTGLKTQVVQTQREVPLPYTKIFRTNAALLLEAVDLIASGRPVYIEVDFKDLLRAFDSAEALYMGNVKDVKHDLFLGCENWEDAKFEAESNGEVARIVKLVESGHYLFIRDTLSKYKHPENPEITFITAHKAKGLEWDNVIIADDYPSAYKDGQWALTEQERNLQYVAHTRAKKILCTGSIVHQISEFLEYGTYADGMEESEALHDAYVRRQVHRLKKDVYDSVNAESFETQVQREMVSMGHRPWEDSAQLAEFAVGPMADDLSYTGSDLHLPN